MTARQVLTPLLMVAVVVAGITGYAFASSDDEAVIEAAMGSAVESALAAVTPEPTPEPTPIPTPWIVVPAECMEAINGLMVATVADLDFIIGVYDAYLDFPDETLGQFGQRVEALIDNRPEPPSDAEIDAVYDAASTCRDAS